MPTGIDVVAIEIASQPPGFESDNRIGLGIERLVPAKDLNGNSVALQLVGPPGKRFFDDVAEESASPPVCLEVRARKEMIQFGPHIANGRWAFGDRTGTGDLGILHYDRLKTTNVRT